MASIIVQQEDPVFLFERNLYGKPVGRTIQRETSRKYSVGTRLEKVPNWECLFVNRQERLFLSVYVWTILNWLARSGTSIRLGTYW